MLPDGKLYVKDAETIIPNLAILTRIAKDENIKVINTADWHYNDSKELSLNPDFITTFPPHCMAGTKGAEFINETKCEDALLVDYKHEKAPNAPLIMNSREIIILKDAFDVFQGNPFTRAIVSNINPRAIFVYGVATNVCVNCAILGLIALKQNVVVIKDAIKELPNIPFDFNTWKEKGVKFVTTEDLEKMIAMMF
jgi:nicotinamidase/pyrazinamidase